MSLNGRVFLQYWLPILAWAALIFSASTDLGSVKHTSRIIGPILKWAFPDITDERIQQIQLGVRKTGHGMEYAILAGLIWRARNRTTGGILKRWPQAIGWQAWMAATAYAASDEYHQSFYPSREASVRDVMIDSTGAAVGLGLIFLWGRFRKRW